MLGDPAGASAAEGERLLGMLVASLTQTLDTLLTAADPASQRKEAADDR